MISIDRERGVLFLSRCDYLYRDGLDNRDETANVEMGDGDIVIPLPDNMRTREFDNKASRWHPERTKGCDGQSAEIIIEEIRRRLGITDDDAT